MCGFAGFFEAGAPEALRGDRLAVVERMGLPLARRGPDEVSLFDGGGLSLVFRRLAVIDLQTGSQPIWNEDRSAFVVVNGEIYNHKELRHRLRGEHHFRTASDSEIVLHLWEEHGPGVFEMLQGMFAIAIWDDRRSKLLLARDRLGIKPLFFTQVGKQLLFGSELKSLLSHPACPRGFRWEHLGEREEIGLVQGDCLRSFVWGIEPLPGGHWAEMVDGRVSTHRYWDLASHFGRSDGPTDVDDLVDRFAATFEDGVRQTLMSDVPVGLFLSGGLDSAAIAAAASRVTKDLHCFTLVEPNVLRSGDAHAARAQAAAFGLPLCQVEFDLDLYTGADAIGLEAIEYFIRATEYPILSPDAFYKHELHRYAKTVVPDLKVMLVGSGADEFWGGYTNQWHAPMPDWARGLANLSEARHGQRLAARRFPSALRPFVDPGYLPAPMEATGRAVYHDEMLYAANVLQNYNLWQDDRTSSCLGVETRVPFLDHRLVELAASVPERLHPEAFFDKTAARRGTQRLLGEEWSRRPKVGFFTGKDMSAIAMLFARLLFNVFDRFDEEYLATPESPFARSKVRGLYQALMSGQRDPMATVPILWAIVTTSIFERMCRTMETESRGRPLDPPSPLRALETLPVLA